MRLESRTASAAATFVWIMSHEVAPHPASGSIFQSMCVCCVLCMLCVMCYVLPENRVHTLYIRYQRSINFTKRWTRVRDLLFEHTDWHSHAHTILLQDHFPGERIYSSLLRENRVADKWSAFSCSFESFALLTPLYNMHFRSPFDPQKETARRDSRASVSQERTRN